MFHISCLNIHDNQNIRCVLYLLFTSLQDDIDVFISNLTLLGREDVSGTVTNDGQHLVFAQLVHARIDQSA